MAESVFNAPPGASETLVSGGDAIAACLKKHSMGRRHEMVPHMWAAIDDPTLAPHLELHVATAPGYLGLLLKDSRTGETIRAN